MFTAKDLHNKLKSLEDCSGIDEWIEDVLYKEFIRFGSYASISTRHYRTEWLEQQWFYARNA